MKEIAEISDILGRKRVIETIFFGNLLQDFFRHEVDDADSVVLIYR